jgi:hypothetical protein
MYNNFNQNLHCWYLNKCRFIVNYLLLYALMNFWCKLPEDGKNFETFEAK